MKCLKCDGSGWASPDERNLRPCRQCQGVGEVRSLLDAFMDGDLVIVHEDQDGAA